MTIKFIKFGAFIIVGVVIVFSFSWAREIVIKNEPIKQLAQIAQINPIESPDFIKKIEEGKELLKKSKALTFEFKKNKNGKVTSNLLRKQIALAILNKNTGEIFEKRVWVKEDDISNYSKTKFLQVAPVLANEKLNIQPTWWNSFNSFFEVENHPELIVVANKYLVLSTSLASLPEKSKNKYTNIIYVPYSKALHTPELIEAGRKYIANNVNLTFAELDNKRVYSLDDPVKLATEKITKDLVRTIMLIEHVDPDGFNVADDGGRELTERVLVIVGANQGNAYRYTGSPAGASGLAQFIKSTYDTIVSKYPSAKLNKNYNLGMADHKNAIQAMVLFFDNYGKDIDNKVTRRDVLNQIGITEEMLVAAYNGGPNRVVSSVNKFGLGWLSEQLDISTTAQIFRKETLDYIKKFKSIKNLGIF